MVHFYKTLYQIKQIYSNVIILFSWHLKFNCNGQFHKIRFVYRKPLSIIDANFCHLKIIFEGKNINKT